MDSYLTEAEESQKVLDQLETMVKARLADMHQWVQDWKACGECEGDPDMPDVTGSKLSPVRVFGQKHFNACLPCTQLNIEFLVNVQ